MRKVSSDARRLIVRYLHLDALERILGDLSAALILWLAIGSLTAIFAIFAFSLYASRIDVAESARTASGNLAEAVGQHISRDVELLDLSLQDLRDGAQSSSIMELSPKLRQLVLFDKAATAHGLGALMLLGADGRVIEQAGTETPAPVELARESFFRVHAERGDVGLFVSQPFVSLLDGEPSIALSRRVDRNGVFAGVAVATIRTSYFKELFEKLDLGPKGTIALLAGDGAIIMRQPFVASMPTHRPLPPSLAELSATRTAGSGEGVSPIDGVRRLLFYNPVGSLPLAVLLGRSIEDVYAAWWRRAASTGVALGLLGNLILILIAALQIALRHRAAAEAELAALARTDKLTGLANRRMFDESLALEWRRAARSRQPLALLLLDIDHFKEFNDHFGHLGGDAVLAAMGSCLAGIPRRPGDIAARYGGEEFAVLLPSTSEADALRIADRIQAQVRTQRQPHPRAPASILTVSIGVAALSPFKDQDPADLLRYADQALYRAKRTGRDRIVLWQEQWAA